MNESSNIEMRRCRAERCLKPWPQTALATLVDLGMSDDKIARYLAVDETFVKRLRDGYRIFLR
ncbi:transposase-like protein [Phyllobacterium ifriqiyense]